MHFFRLLDWVLASIACYIIFSNMTLPLALGTIGLLVLSNVCGSIAEIKISSLK